MSISSRIIDYPTVEQDRMQGVEPCDMMGPCCYSPTTHASYSDGFKGSAAVTMDLEDFFSLKIDDNAKSAKVIKENLRRHARDESACMEWYGVKTNKDVLNIATHGCSARARLIETFGQSLMNPRIMGIRKQRQWSASIGSYVDKSRLYGGRLDFWSSSAPQGYAYGGKNFVHIYVETSAAWFYNGVQLSWRPVLALALANALESAGYSVAISAVDSCSRIFENGRPTVETGEKAGGRDLFIQVDVKRYGEPMSLRGLSAMSYGFFMRYYGFKAMACALPDGGITEGFGYMSGWSHLPRFLFTEGENAVWIDGIFNRDEAAKRLIAIAERFGVNGTPAAAAIANYEDLIKATASYDAEAAGVM